MARVSVEYRVLDSKAPSRVADPGTNAIAEALMRDAQSRTPVSSDPRTHGKLKAGWSKAKIQDAEYRVFNDVRHAKFVEFGTRKMDPEPMLGPALMAARSSVGA